MTPEQARLRLEEIAKGHAPPVTNIAKVKSVDVDAGVCVLIDEDDQEIFDVRLRPVVSNNKSFLAIPKVNSYVMAVRIEDSEDWMLIACDEVEKYVFTVGSTVFELSNKVHIESGGESLATLMDDLFTLIAAMVFVTPAGNSTALLNAAAFSQLQLRFKTLLN